MANAELRNLARRLRRLKHDVATEIADDLLEQFPNLQDQYGPRTRDTSVADVEYHLDYLAAAIEQDTPVSFEAYVRWVRNVLTSRGMTAELVARTFGHIGSVLFGMLETEDAEVVARYIDLARQVCEHSPPEPAPEEKLGDAQSVFLHAILDGDRRAAANIAHDCLDSGMGLDELYLDVFERCMYTIGSLWEHNRISVADEHLATATVQATLAQIFAEVDIPAPSRGNCVITGIQGEMHQVGPHLVSDVLETDGWSVRFLGTNTPIESIIDICGTHEADVLGVSATILFNVARVADLISRVRDEMGETAPRIITGGAAFVVAPNIWRDIGADDFARDLSEARSALNSWWCECRAAKGNAE